MAQGDRLRQFPRSSKRDKIDRECTLCPGVHHKIEVDYADLKKTFQVYKGVLQQRIPMDACRAFFISHQPFLARDQLRANLFQALLNGAAPHCEEGSVEFLINPLEVRAKVSIDKNALQLVYVAILTFMSFSSFYDFLYEVLAFL